MHNGTTISDLELTVLRAEVIADFTELARAYPEMFGRCMCGSIRLNCDCPKPDPRFDMEDDPARQR